MKVGISPTITEFDLESFFNLVSQRKINEILEKRGLPAWLRNWIAWVNSNPPRFDLKDLKEEKELTGEDLDLNILMKRGLPQGLAWSPLLSILVLDETFKKLEIDPILFADDGIIISESEEDYKKLLNGEKILLEHGIKLSDKIKPDGSKATRVIDDDLVTFVGVTWRTEDDKVILDNGEEIPRKLITDKQLLKLIWNKYEGEMGWRWEIKPGSWLQKYIFTERIPEESSKVNIGLSKIAQDIYFKDAFENRGMKSPQTWLSSEAQVDLLNLLSENSGKTSDQVSLEEKFADDVWGVNKVDQDINQWYIPEILRKMSSPLTRGKDSLMFDLNKRFNLNRKYFGEVGLFTMESYVSQLDIPLLRL